MVARLIESFCSIYIRFGEHSHTIKYKNPGNQHKYKVRGCEAWYCRDTDRGLIVPVSRAHAIYSHLNITLINYYDFRIELRCKKVCSIFSPWDLATGNHCYMYKAGVVWTQLFLQHLYNAYVTHVVRECTTTLLHSDYLGTACVIMLISYLLISTQYLTSTCHMLRI